MKKTPFIIFNKKHIFFAITFCFAILLLTFAPVGIKSLSPKSKYVVVIDAGHGGIDGGCVGRSTGVTEASLNLDYAKCLQEMMQNFGFDVVMTRTTESGLYSPLASNKKRDDMKKRKSIVENANADFVISIHMNSYRGDARGALVYYGNDDEPSKSLAGFIQKHFLANLVDAKKEIKIGDYYVLNELQAPSVLVECGYLSNIEEEALLVTEEYRKEVCYSILLGVLEYLR